MTNLNQAIRRWQKAVPLTLRGHGGTHGKCTECKRGHCKRGHADTFKIVTEIAAGKARTS